MRTVAKALLMFIIILVIYYIADETIKENSNARKTSGVNSTHVR